MKVVYDWANKVRIINYDGSVDMQIGNLPYSGHPSINYNETRISFIAWDGDYELYLWDENGMRVSTPAGSDVSVNSGRGIEVTYPSVVSACTTEFTYNAGGHDLPSGKWAGLSVLHYFLSSTCAFTPPVQVRINYNETDYFFEAGLRLYQWTGSAWNDVTTGVDQVNNRITGSASSLGEFVILEDQPIQVQTPAGNNVEVDSGLGVKVIYPSVSSTCQTAFLVKNGGSPMLSGAWAGRHDLRYLISTNCQYTGPVQVIVDYDETDFVVEQMLHLARYDAGSASWQDTTTNLNMIANQIQGSSNLLGEFAVLEPAPSEAATMPGFDVVVDLGEVSLKYPQVLSACTTYLSLVSRGTPVPPERWPGGHLKRYFLSSTCNYTGNIEVTIGYDDSDYISPSDVYGIGMFWFSGTSWQEVTTVPGRIKGVIPRLGELAVLERLPNPIWTPAGDFTVSLDLGDVKVDYGVVPDACQTWLVHWTGGVPLAPWFSDGTSHKRYYFSTNCRPAINTKFWVNYNESEFNIEQDLGVFYYDGLFWQEVTSEQLTGTNWIAGEFLASDFPNLGLEIAVLEKLRIQDWTDLRLKQKSAGGGSKPPTLNCAVWPGEESASLWPLAIMLLLWAVIRFRKRLGNGG